MKLMITMLAGLAIPYLAFAQCSEISIDPDPTREISVVEIPDGGLDAEFFWYPAYNGGFQDETITLMLCKISGPDDWTYSICRGEEFCVLIFFGDCTEPAENILESDVEDIDYDVQVVARSFGTAVLEATFVREFCPEDTIRQTLTLTVSEDTYVAETPRYVQLRQNYPNPFNPLTNIPFSLLQGGLVNIEVYNLKGEKLVTLVDNMYHAAGSHVVPFNAENLPSGSYYYRVGVPGETVSERMILLK
jgi:hypothetical protein